MLTKGDSWRTRERVWIYSDHRMACGRTLFSRVIGRVRRWKMFQPLRMVVLLDGESGESEEALEVMDSKPGVL